MLVLERSSEVMLMLRQSPPCPPFARGGKGILPRVGGVIGMIAVMGGVWLGAWGGELASTTPLVLHAQLREPSPAQRTDFVVKEKTLSWEPGEDGDHHLRHVGSALVQGSDPQGRRAGAGDEPGGRAAAREKGVLIIHAPEQLHGSRTRTTPRAKRAQAAPKAANLPGDIDGWCKQIPAEEKGVYPDRPGRRRLRRRPAVPGGLALAVAGRRDRDPRRGRHQRLGSRDLEPAGEPRDHQRHAHGRPHEHVRPRPAVRPPPAGRHGKNVVLVRDLTDTMYNSRSWPYVSHFEGTNRIVEHVEKYVCPTITSTDLTGQPAFSFQPDHRPRAVFVIGDDEYKTETTLPAFANAELEPRGRTVHVRDRRPEDAA